MECRYVKTLNKRVLVVPVGKGEDWRKQGEVGLLLDKEEYPIEANDRKAGPAQQREREEKEYAGICERVRAILGEEQQKSAAAKQAAHEEQQKKAAGKNAEERKKKKEKEDEEQKREEEAAAKAKASAWEKISNRSAELLEQGTLYFLKQFAVRECPLDADCMRIPKLFVLTTTPIDGKHSHGSFSWQQTTADARLHFLCERPGQWHFTEKEGCPVQDGPGFVAATAPYMASILVLLQRMPREAVWKSTGKGLPANWDAFVRHVDHIARLAPISGGRVLTSADYRLLWRKAGSLARFSEHGVANMADAWALFRALRRSFFDRCPRRFSLQVTQDAFKTYSTFLRGLKHGGEQVVHAHANGSHAMSLVRQLSLPSQAAAPGPPERSADWTPGKESTIAELTGLQRCKLPTGQVLWMCDKCREDVEHQEQRGQTSVFHRRLASQSHEHPESRPEAITAEAEEAQSEPKPAKTSSWLLQGLGPGAAVLDAMAALEKGASVIRYKKELYRRVRKQQLLFVKGKFLCWFSIGKAAKEMADTVDSKRSILLADIIAIQAGATTHLLKTLQNVDADRFGLQKFWVSPAVLWTFRFSVCIRQCNP
jgi:hypothetical protein